MTAIRTSQAQVSSDMINLGIGQPGFDILPLDVMRRAAEHRLSHDDRTLLNYGYEQGDENFRQALSGFLSAGYGMPVKAKELFATGGASQALDLICTIFTKPGDTIFVEEPTYFLAFDVFATHHLHVVSIPTDEQGLVVDALEEKLFNSEKTGHPVFLYTVPTFQNPSSVTLSEERRESLLALSNRYNFFIVADEVYQLLNYSTTPPLPMAAYIESETVISIGSFSKILAPGLRLGWIQTSKKLIKKLTTCGLIKSGGSLNHFTSGLVRSVIEMGLQDEYLSNLKILYKKRVRALESFLFSHLPDLEFIRPDGGFFFWVRIPDNIDTTELLSIARKQKTGFQPGMRFSNSRELNDYVRLSFTFYDIPDLEEGIKRLHTALNIYMEEKKNDNRRIENA